MNSENQTMVSCPGCHASFPDQEGPIWAYGVTSSGCWHAYTQLLGYERDRYDFPDENRLVVDAYAVQHPQNVTLQKKLGIHQRLIDASIQSVAVHLIALYCALEKKMPLNKVTNMIARLLSKNVRFERLDPPKSRGSVTIADFSPDFTQDDYKKFAWKWAQNVWMAWSPYHDNVRTWYTDYLDK